MGEIAILDLGYESYEYEKKLFKRKGYDLKLYRGDPLDQEEKIKFARNCQGILVRSTVVDDYLLGRLKNLKAIVRYGVGIDNINLKRATEIGIKVANVQRYANHSVSDHALALMMLCVRGLAAGKKKINSDFSKPPFTDIIELHDKTLGIIGLGNIGSVFCRKAKALFNKVLANDPYIDQEKFDRLEVEKTNFEGLLRQSDIISLHCSLTDETRHLINKNSIKLMKKKPVLINTARGPIVMQSDLLKAIDSGLIHSAGLDVLENEPPGDEEQKLIKHPRIFVTGHYAWYSENAIAELQKRAANNLIDLLNGKNPEDCLN